ncbi:MAG: HAMP domain-containing sensor histidine kinase [Pseudomonadota bacterium]
MMFFFFFVLSIAGIGYYVLSGTYTATLERLDAEITAQIDYLTQMNNRVGENNVEGFNLMHSEVERLNIIEKESRYLVLVYVKSRRSYLQVSNTGNLAEYPPEVLYSKDLFQFDYEIADADHKTGLQIREARVAVGRAQKFYYNNDRLSRAIVFVYRDITDVSDMLNTAQTVVLRTSMFALILALVLGILYSGIFLRRVDHIGQTVKAISSGDLNRRIALQGSQDEFDTLSENINEMLNQIERLMTGMRQVSDNIAHDLRSPLTRIKARLDRALSEGEGADLSAVVDKTTEDVERLLATFNALLSITRIESGEGGGTKTAVDVAAVAEEMLELYEPAAAEAGFKLIGNISPAPLVMGSRELISQAIANLLDNALKYAKGSEDQPNEDPTIELKVAPGPNRGTLLSIVDNGPGVSEADEKHILKRFVRLEESRSTLGNGLGLSLVSAIAQRHQAKLTIGRGLRHHPEGRKLSVHTAYGLGIRILFPPALKPSKKGLVTSVTQTQGKA